MNNLETLITSIINLYLIIKQQHIDDITCRQNEIELSHKIKMLQIYPIECIRSNRYDVIIDAIKGACINTSNIDVYNLINLCASEPNESINMTFVKQI